MDLLASDAGRLRFEAYVKDVAGVIGHADRERKSVANAPWSDQAVLAKVRQTVLPKIEVLGAIAI